MHLKLLEQLLNSVSMTIERRPQCLNSLCIHLNLKLFMIWLINVGFFFLSELESIGQMASGFVGQSDRDFKCLNICILIKIGALKSYWLTIGHNTLIYF